MNRISSARSISKFSITTFFTTCATLVIAAFIAAPSFGSHGEWIVQLKDAKGENAGKAHLTEADHGVSIKLDLEARKIAPGKHGIHFHEKGLCEGPDFKSAGGHLNPAAKQHGLDNPGGAHAGDMPNFEASRSGTFKGEILAPGVTLMAGPQSLERAEGVALVIHAKADDQKSNPAGDSGDRVLCGVVAKDAKK